MKTFLRTLQEPELYPGAEAIAPFVDNNLVALDHISSIISVDKEVNSTASSRDTLKEDEGEGVGLERPKALEEADLVKAGEELEGLGATVGEQVVVCFTGSLL